MPRVRSDVFFQGKAAFAVEVVVTHPIKTVTMERYLAARLPVLEVRPTWTKLASLRTSLFASSTQNIPTGKCPTCKKAKHRKEERKRGEEKRKRREEERATLALKAEKARALAVQLLQPKELVGDYEKEVQRVPREVRAVARKLLQLGMLQESQRGSAGKPTSPRAAASKTVGAAFRRAVA